MAKKILKRSLALGALMAFVITGSAMAEEVSNPIYETTTIEDPIIVNNNPAGVCLSYEDKGVVHYMTFGLASYTSGIDIILTGPSIIIDTDTNHNTRTIDETRTVYASSGGTIALGTKNSSISVNAKGTLTQSASGIMAIGAGAKIDINAHVLNVNASGNDSMGIHVQNNYDKPIADSNAAAITINANTINITSDSLGISAFSNGQMNINGNLTVNAKNAIDVRGNSSTNINTDGKYTTVLNGDLVFETPATADNSHNSGKIINAYVDINFNGAESVWNGRAYQAYNGVKTVVHDVDSFWGKVTGMNVSFNNGATWNLTDESFANNVSFGAGSNLVIEGAKFVESTDKYALNGSSTDSLKVEKGANLVIEGMEKNTYNIAKGFGTNEGENFTVVNDNALMQAQMVFDKTASELKAVVTAKSAADVISSGITSTSAAGAVSQLASELSAAGGNPDNVAPANRAAAQFLNDVMSGIASGNKTAQNIKDAMDSTFNVGENVGANANAAAVVNNVSGITTQRMSFTNVSTTPQGGHGKVERKYKSGEGVWAQYMHGKDKVEDMPMSDATTSYDSQYNGIVFGYDFKEVGKTHTGIAFNYGSGDSHGATSSTYSRSEFDFWGVGLYHSIMNDDTNLVFDINYNKSDTDVTQNGLGGLVTANPKTDTISVGMKAEKLIQNGPVQIVPYAGLRYMSINTDDYHVAALNATYSPERQNVWLIPVGVSLRQENVYENGWKVTPKADLSYIWALGDTDSSMTVAVGNVAPFTNSYTVMDNGSFLGTLGLEASKGDWTYGLSYSYQKGEYQRSDKWFVDVRYSF